jgi:signal transduction histidine kinase
MERALLLFKNRLPIAVILKTDFSDLPKARGDEATFVRLWAHLIQNALQSMSGGGVLLLSIRREGGFAAVSIDDEGDGVSPQVADSLFEPFVTTRPPAEGMGLGLAYCKRVVEAAGGTISWAGKERGTVFTVRIPLVEEA